MHCCGGLSNSSSSAITLCSSVPRSACSLEGLGGILAQSATDAGQLMTRLAVEPPTILEWFTVLS